MQQTSGISSKPINQGWILGDANEAVASDPISLEVLRRVRDFSVWPIRSGRLGLECFDQAVSVTGHFGLGVSVWAFRSRDI